MVKKDRCLLTGHTARISRGKATEIHVSFEGRVCVCVVGVVGSGGGGRGRGENSSVDRASDPKAGRNTDTGSRPGCGKGFLYFCFCCCCWFHSSQLSVWLSTFSVSDASLAVFAQPPCAIACINVRAHVTNTELWHTLAATGSAALAAAVLPQGKATRISRDGFTEN